MSNTFKSVRLNQAIRQNIIDAMMISWALKQPAPIDPKIIEAQLADDIYKEVYGAIDKFIKKVPTLMLRKSRNVLVSVAGKFEEFAMSEERPMEFRDTYCKSIIQVLDAPTSLMNTLDQAEENMKDWKKSKKEFLEEITTILETVTTTGSLIQLWPEAEQYLPPFAADPSKGINLPALKTTRLNSLLGIK